MTITTDAGDKLAMKLNPAIGTTLEIRKTCALIHRQAATYDLIQERWCNDDMGDKARARLEAKESRIEARITELVGDLPHTDEGPIEIKFGGDPRGYTVKLVMPGSLEKLHNDWGREGIGVYEGRG